MKKLMLVLALVVLLAFTGSVMANKNPNETVITGNVEACSIGLTVPVDTTITLARSSDNIQGIGYVTVINNCNTKWKASVVADNANMYSLITPSTSSSPNYNFLTSVMYISTDMEEWTPFETAPSVGSVLGLNPTEPIELAEGSGAASIPVYVKQPVSPSDEGGAYTIKFTFGLEQGS